MPVPDDTVVDEAELLTYILPFDELSVNAGLFTARNWLAAPMSPFSVCICRLVPAVITEPADSVILPGPAASSWTVSPPVRLPLIVIDPVVADFASSAILAPATAPVDMLPAVICMSLALPVAMTNVSPDVAADPPGVAPALPGLPSVPPRAMVPPVGAAPDPP